MLSVPGCFRRIWLALVGVATKKSCCLVLAMPDVMHEVITARVVGELLLILLPFGIQGACLQYTQWLEAKEGTYKCYHLIFSSQQGKVVVGSGNGALMGTSTLEG